MKNLLILALALVIAGCASYGTKIDSDAVSKIVKGKTTEQQVVTLLGSPMSVSVTQDGVKMLMYVHSHSQAKASTFIPIVGAFVGGADTKTQTLQVWIDKEGLVSSFAFNNSQQELNTGILAN